MPEAGEASAPGERLLDQEDLTGYTGPPVQADVLKVLESCANYRHCLCFISIWFPNSEALRAALVRDPSGRSEKVRGTLRVTGNSQKGVKKVAKNHQGSS